MDINEATRPRILFLVELGLSFHVLFVCWQAPWGRPDRDFKFSSNSSHAAGYKRGMSNPIYMHAANVSNKTIVEPVELGFAYFCSRHLWGSEESFN